MPQPASPTRDENAPAPMSMPTPWANTKSGIQAWSGTCDVYAKYFASLARSQTPQAIIAANMELMSGSLQVLSLNAMGLDKTVPATS